MNIIEATRHGVDYGIAADRCSDDLVYIQMSAGLASMNVAIGLEQAEQFSAQLVAVVAAMKDANAQQRRTAA